LVLQKQDLLACVTPPSKAGLPTLELRVDDPVDLSLDEAFNTADDDRGDRDGTKGATVGSGTTFLGERHHICILPCLRKSMEDETKVDEESDGANEGWRERGPTEQLTINVIRAGRGRDGSGT